MLEIFINAIKFAVSKEARESATALVDLFRDSPAWKEDLCTLRARISRSQRERATLLQEIVAAKLANLRYDTATVSSFQTVYHELAANAFEHGATKDRHVVDLVLDVSPSYVTMDFRNPSGAPVQLDQWLRIARARIQADKSAARGRGLMLCALLSDTLAASDENGVRATLFRERVKVVHSCLQGIPLAMVSLQGGSGNPSCARRLQDVLARYPDHRLVICIDGVSDLQFADQIREVLRKAPTPSAPVRQPPGDDRSADRASGEDNLILIVLSEAGTSRRVIPLDLSSDLLVGRGAESTIQVEDATVSRKHVRLRRNGKGSVLIEDLGSKGGTWLNGQRTGSGVMRPGDELRIGLVRLVLSAQGQGTHDRQPDDEVPKTGALRALDSLHGRPRPYVIVCRHDGVRSMLPAESAFPEIGAALQSLLGREWSRSDVDILTQCLLIKTVGGDRDPDPIGEELLPASPPIAAAVARLRHALGGTSS